MADTILHPSQRQTTADQVLKFARDVEITDRVLSEHEIVGVLCWGPRPDTYVCACGHEAPDDEFVRHQSTQVVLALLEDRS